MDTLRTQSGLPPSRIDFLDEVAKTCSEQKFYIVLNEIPVKIEKQIVLEQLQKFGEMENIEILFNSDWLGRFSSHNWQNLPRSDFDVLFTVWKFLLYSQIVL